jgi:hypothetical protein
MPDICQIGSCTKIQIIILHSIIRVNAVLNGYSSVIFMKNAKKSFYKYSINPDFRIFGF